MDVCASDVCVCVRLGVRLCCAVKDFRKCGYFKKNRLVWYEGGFLKMRTNFTVKNRDIFLSQDLFCVMFLDWRSGGLGHDQV